MKISAIVTDGAEQLHLQPETDWEEMILKSFATATEPVLVHHGVDFFETMGGFMRGTTGGRGLSLVRGVRKETP